MTIWNQARAKHNRKTPTSRPMMTKTVGERPASSEPPSLLHLRNAYACKTCGYHEHAKWCGARPRRVGSADISFAPKTPLTAESFWPEPLDPEALERWRDATPRPQGNLTRDKIMGYKADGFGPVSGSRSALIGQAEEARMAAIKASRETMRQEMANTLRDMLRLRDVPMEDDDSEAEHCDSCGKTYEDSMAFINHECVATDAMLMGRDMSAHPGGGRLLASKPIERDLVRKHLEDHYAAYEAHQRGLTLDEDIAKALEDKRCERHGRWPCNECGNPEVNK